MTRWGRRAALLAGAALVGVSAAAAAPSVLDRRAVPPAVDLVAFDGCDAALAELRRAVAPHVGVYGLNNRYGTVSAESSDARVAAVDGGSVPLAAPQAPQQQQPQGHSTTNVHEVGVEEADLVKTDGKRVVTAVDEKLRVLDVASREVTGTVDLPGGYVSQLLLHQDRALVISRTGGVVRHSATDSPTGEGATLTLVELSGAPRVAASLAVDGRYVDARQIGGVVRIVVHSGPRLPWVHPQGGRSQAESLIRNREIAAAAPLEAWLPRYELSEAGARSEGPLVACDRISRPAAHSATSMLTVLTFDFPGELGTGDAVTIMADGDTVYGTGTSLYVADDHRLTPAREAATPTTAVHQFDISRPGPPEHVASGRVAGVLLNQYSLSEHQGHLRVATTTTAFDAPRVPENPPPSQSSVTVLRRDGAKLVEVGKVDGLGVGERIYSVRFTGPVGYVVTFRRTDPLYTLDLSDPAEPRVVGELKITGYSAYLHPAGDGRLIGVGQEASERGWVLGAQVSLFDVSDAASPRRVAQHHLPGAHSEVEFDPHAFLYWPAGELVVLPVVEASAAAGEPAAGPSSGALVLRLGEGAFTNLGTVRHEAGDRDADIRRALVIGGDLWTVSAAGARVDRVDGLTARAWIPFS